VRVDSCVPRRRFVLVFCPRQVARAGGFDFALHARGGRPGAACPGLASSPWGRPVVRVALSFFVLAMRRGPAIAWFPPVPLRLPLCRLCFATDSGDPVLVGTGTSRSRLSGGCARIPRAGHCAAFPWRSGGSRLFRPGSARSTPLRAGDVLWGFLPGPLAARALAALCPLRASPGRTAQISLVSPRSPLSRTPAVPSRRLARVGWPLMRSFRFCSPRWLSRG